MNKTKGIAIRVPVELLDQIEQHDLPRNELVNQAITAFFSHQPMNQSQNKADTIEDNSNAVYDEVYSVLYNTEIQPLRKQMEQQQKLIDVLQEEVIEYKSDKRFLQDQILRLQNEKSTGFSIFKKKRR